MMLSKPEVAVGAIANGGHPKIEIAVGASPPADLAERVAEISIPSWREDALAAAVDTAEYQVWRTLGRQIDEARDKVTEARRTFERVRAAKRLLEDRPEDDLANKLRGIAAEIESADTNKAEAEAELREIQHLIPRHWAPAASAIASTVSTLIFHRITALHIRQKPVWDRIAEARQKAAAAIEAIVAEHLLPVLAEQALVGEAVELAGQQEKSFTDAILAQLMGATPEGVVRVKDRYEPAPPKPKPPEAPPTEPAPTNPMRVIHAI